MTARKVLSALKAVARPDKAEFLPGFFQAYPGGYGEGDRFLGCVVPDQRKVARQFRDLPQAELAKLLASPWHECRLTAIYILVGQFERGSRASNPDRDQDQRRMVDFLLENLEAVNNWDLVDSCGPKILGPRLLEHTEERGVLDSLAASDIMWHRRLAVVSNYALIRGGQFAEICSRRVVTVRST